MLDSSQILSLSTDALGACSGWFGRILNSSGMLSFYLSFIFLMILFKFIISPIVGDVGSDIASKRKDLVTRKTDE